MEKLRLEGITPHLATGVFTWERGSDTYNISLDRIACSGKKVAWFQSSRQDDYALIVFDETGKFHWEPTSYNLAFGCYCGLIDWVDEHLIFVYKEKYETYICSYRAGQIRTFNFDGERISRDGNVILFDSFAHDDVTVRCVRLPDLVELEPRSREEVRSKGLLPDYVEM